MEKEQTESKQEGFVKENESTESTEIRHEIAGKSDSIPPQKKSNSSTVKRVKKPKRSPSEEEDKNNKEPSPLEGRVAELEQQLEQAETQRREGEEQLSTTQKALAGAVSRYRALLLESTPEAPESMVMAAKPSTRWITLSPKRGLWCSRCGATWRRSLQRSGCPPAPPPAAPPVFLPFHPWRR